MIISLGAAGVILMHAPGRAHFKGFADRHLAIPPLKEEVQLIRALGSDVWAIGLHEEGLDEAAAVRWCRATTEALAIPCSRPLRDGGEELARIVQSNTGVHPR